MSIVHSFMIADHQQSKSRDNNEPYTSFIASIKSARFTLGRRQSKTAILSRNVDQKSVETVFLIAICRHTGDKWQSKTLFLSIFDPYSSIVDYIFDCRLPGVRLELISKRQIRQNDSLPYSTLKH